MSTMSLVEEQEMKAMERPGAQLAFIREKKGYTPEFVASQLHLRTRLIELLESDNYEQLPQPVFIKGYMRAYAKLLGVAPEPFISAYANSFIEERKLERTLWQSRREPSSHERLVRWVTGLIVVSALLGLTFWWKTNNTHPSLHNSSQMKTQSESTVSVLVPPKENYLTQVAKIQSLFKTEDKVKSATGDGRD